jgi:hypothetical protein
MQAASYGKVKVRWIELRARMLTKTPETEAALSQPAAAPFQWAALRKRLSVVVMSLVVGWHSLAMLVAPAPGDSVTAQSLRYVLQPYLSLLRLDNGWAFFVPVGKHAQFRYEVRDGAGNDHTFTPSEEPADSLPKYVWWREFKYLYDGIMDSPQVMGGVAGAILCETHAELDPLFVTLLQVQEENFWPEDQLAGKHPLDQEFVTVNSIVRVPCRSSPMLPSRPPIRPQRKRT